LENEGGYMQLMADAITVFGSRFGVAINPARRECYLIKANEIKSFPFEIRAGVEFEGKKIFFPLCKNEKYFDFLDQDSTPTTIQLSGIDPESGLHVKLTLRSLFKPRDIFLSTIPVIYIEVEVKRLLTSFRWFPLRKDKIKGKIFIEISSDRFKFEEGKENELKFSYSHIIRRPPQTDKGLLAQTSKLVDEERKCTNKISGIEGKLENTTFYQEFELLPGEEGKRIVLCWADYEKPILMLKNGLAEFKYTEYFKNLDEVSEWARKNYNIALDNSKKVDGIILSHNLGNSVSHLLIYTLHSWLFDTWYVRKPEGGDWYSVWEGSCYFHSTVDVEHTQTPFYLTVWPELLELELDEWPAYAKDGEKVIGERGKNTLYLSHDIGILANADRQYYPHDMEVEESANYIIMAYVHWRRTAKDTIIKKHADFIQKLMDFILACDTTGNGFVDRCCANTIDDASPAIQFGREQVYLAVKAMAAISCGVEILSYVMKDNVGKYNDFVLRAISTLEKKGWKEDHYIVTLTKTADGLVDPWTGKEMSGELEGWDSYHIYTENGMALLEMTGKRIGLKEERIRADILNAVKKTLLKYGCRHSSYIPHKTVEAIEGLASGSNKVGWISMNMLRDIAGGYYGLDLFSLAGNYWDWQLTTNTQDIYLFFETFYGNNLNLYPRGLAIFGYMDGISGFVYDKVKNLKRFSPVRANIDVPLYLFADWEKGKVLKVKSYLKGNKIEFETVEEIVV
jgi:hypothetical protein